MHRSLIVWLGILAATFSTGAVASEGSRQDFAPSVSPDGSKLAFYSYRGELLPDIYVLVLKTGKERRLTHSEDRWDLGAVWSPESQRLFFASGVEGADTMAIYSVEPDGSELRQETHPPKGIRHAEVSFSKDGNWMVFARFEGKDKSAFVLRNRKTGADTDVLVSAKAGEQNLKPRLHPKGNNLLFVSNRDGQKESFDLYTLDLGTRKIRRITETKANERMPMWSEDGAEIFFSSNLNGRSYDLYSMPALDATKAQRLTRFNDREELNSFQTGTSIYFDAGHYGSEEGGNTFIYKMERGAKDPEQVTGKKARASTTPRGE